MRAAILGAVIAFAATGPAAAGLDRAMQMFQHYCVATGAEPEAVQEAAARDGFVVRPQLSSRVAREVPGGVVMAIIEDGHAYLVTTGHEQVGGGLETDICNVQVDPAPGADEAVAAMTRWVRLPPSRTTRGAVIWGYVEADGERVPLERLAPDARRLALAEGRARVVTVDVDGGRNGAGLMFTVSRRGSDR